MSKALVLGIALSSNIGGMASPIASPQNLIALQNMAPEPGWGLWFFIALPVCIISVVSIWLMLVLTMHPDRGTNIVPIRPMKDKFTGIQWFISIVTLVTIALWCVAEQFKWLFGDMGVIAIIPIVLFFGTGILTKEDFNNFLWTIIILAAGGLALGSAVSSSGLLHTIAEWITTDVEGMSLYLLLVTFAAIILVAATFISHTVSALIFLPLVQSVGKNMADPHPNLLVMGAVLMCSAAMGLPTSGFPNMSKRAFFRRSGLETNVPPSGYHDGGSTDWPAVSASPALSHARYSRVDNHLCRRHHGGLRADALGSVIEIVGKVLMLRYQRYLSLCQSDAVGSNLEAEFLID